MILYLNFLYAGHAPATINPPTISKSQLGSNRRGCQRFPQTFQRRGEEVFTAARNDEIRHSADNLLLVTGISP